VTYVRLRVWGATEQDAEAAEAGARQAAAANDWRIEEPVDRTVDVHCPIPRQDRAALTQGKAYRQAWAFYPPALTLEQAYTAMRPILDRLGIDIGTEVLDVWLDRRRAGRAPLPEADLRELSALVQQLLGDARHTAA
jgi:hypothetical protein